MWRSGGPRSVDLAAWRRRMRHSRHVLTEPLWACAGDLRLVLGCASALIAGRGGGGRDGSGHDVCMSRLGRDPRPWRRVLDRDDSPSQGRPSLMSARFRRRRSALTDMCGSPSPAPIVVDRASLAEAGEVSTRLAAGAPRPRSKAVRDLAGFSRGSWRWDRA